MKRIEDTIEENMPSRKTQEAYKTTPTEKVIYIAKSLYEFTHWLFYAKTYECKKSRSAWWDL